MSNLIKSTVPTPSEIIIIEDSLEAMELEPTPPTKRGYAERMSKVYNESVRIHRDETTNIPFYKDDNTNVLSVCDGLHLAMKDTFFSWKTWHTVSKKYGSSKNTGIMVHRQLRHFYTCMTAKNGQCECGGTKKVRMSKYTRAIIQFLTSKDIIIDDTEIPIYDRDAKVITWIDAIGHVRSNPDTIVKISLKTGYSPKFKSDSHGFVFDNIGNNSRIPCTTENIYHLQSLCEDIILTRVYDMKPNYSITLYVYEERPEVSSGNLCERIMMASSNPTKVKREVHCEEVRYPEWCRVIQTRNEIYKSLLNRKSKKATQIVNESPNTKFGV